MRCVSLSSDSTSSAAVGSRHLKFFWIQLYSSAYVIVFTDVEAAKESMISTKFRLYESNSKTCGHEGSKRVNQWRYIGVSQVR